MQITYFIHENWLATWNSVTKMESSNLTQPCQLIFPQAFSQGYVIPLTVSELDEWQVIHSTVEGKVSEGVIATISVKTPNLCPKLAMLSRVHQREYLLNLIIPENPITHSNTRQRCLL